VLLPVAATKGLHMPDASPATTPRVQGKWVSFEIELPSACRAASNHRFSRCCRCQ